MLRSMLRSMFKLKHERKKKNTCMSSVPSFNRNFTSLHFKTAAAHVLADGMFSRCVLTVGEVLAHLLRLIDPSKDPRLFKLDHCTELPECEISQVAMDTGVNIYLDRTSCSLSIRFRRSSEATTCDFPASLDRESVTTLRHHAHTTQCVSRPPLLESRKAHDRPLHLQRHAHVQASCLSPLSSDL